MQTDHSRVPAWLQVAGGLGLGYLAYRAVLVDIANNHEYGISIKQELGTVFVLAAVCVVALPAASAIFGRHPLLRWGTWACVVLTVWAAINAYTKEFGADILAKNNQAAIHAGAEKDEASARATLERIKETADASTLEAMASTAKAKADTAEKSDTAKMRVLSCFKPCREAKDAHIALLGRLADAKARDAAKKALGEAKTEAKAGSAEASMIATLIASWTGKDANDIARTIALVITIIGIIVTQMVALLAHLSASLIMTGVRAYFPASEAPAAPAPKIAATIQTKVSDKDAAYRWLIGQIADAPGRQLIASGRRLAETLAMPNPTFAGWVATWIEEGKLERSRSGNTTVFTVPKASKVRRAA